MERSRMKSPPNRGSGRIEGWFKSKGTPSDDYCAIVKVAPGVYELVGGPEPRVPVAVVGRKTDTYHPVSRNSQGNHPQKFAPASESPKVARE